MQDNLVCLPVYQTKVSEVANQRPTILKCYFDENTLKSKVKDCLLKNSKNKSIDSVKYYFDDETGKLTVNVNITTIYGKTGGVFVV